MVDPVFSFSRMTFIRDIKDTKKIEPNKFLKMSLHSEFETSAMVEGVQTITSKKQLLQEYDFIMIIQYNFNLIILGFF